MVDLILPFLLVFALGVGGCSLKTSVPADTLRVQLGAEPVSLDPALAEDGVSMRILGNVMEGLVGYDGAGELQNRLAQSYQISADGKKYEFTLRPNARWSDGKPVTAEDFVTGIERVLSPKTASKLAPLFRPIRTVKSENGKLVIELDRPASYFIQALALSTAGPARGDILAANHGSWPETAPVTGPYRLTSHVVEQKIILERNPFYYGSAPAIARVEFLIVSDESTAGNLFETRRLDILTKVPSLELERFEKKGVVHTDPFVATYYLSFNARKAPFNEVQWRRAVAGSIHKDEIVKAMGTGETPARSWIPMGIEGFEPYSDRREAFADSLAWAARKGAPKEPVMAAFDTSGRNSMIMEKVQQDLLKNTGIRLSLSNMDWKSYIKMLQTDAPPLFRFGWLAPFKDPIMHLKVFTTGDPNNYSVWSDPEYDRLVARIETAADGPGREALVHEAEKILTETQAIVIPIFHYNQSNAVSPRVTGFRVNLFGVILVNELGLKQ